jgi:A/G-specific adenine glycosylase
VLVSEVMLQQTPVARVTPVWRDFIGTYPTPASLADAPLAEVLQLWSGLGYPRRARNLRASAVVIVERHGGRVPSTLEELLALPGVGPYTARAVLAFAFAQPVGVLDTNAGRVLARALANDRLGHARAQQLADELVSGGSPSVINQALLDVGAQHCRSLPRCGGCPLGSFCLWRKVGGDDPAQRSAGVSRPQPRYAGSDREARGRLVRALGAGELDRDRALAIIDGTDRPRAERVLSGLAADGMIAVSGGSVRVAD